jgi:predicted nucleic acid-binding Zn ribbon protein
MADIRHCDQCGRAFEPRREHARFCSGSCRVAWNRAHRRDPATELRALDWSVAGLAELTPRLAALSGADRGRAVAVVSEAVWQVTIVDATLIRYYPDVYDAVLARRSPQRRRLIEGTMAGLRFVRNRMRSEAERDAFICPSAAVDLAGEGPGGPCTWQPVPEPRLDVPRGARRTWELSRYQAYQDFLAGHSVDATFGRATEFLRLAAAEVPAGAGLAAPTGR